MQFDKGKRLLNGSEFRYVFEKARRHKCKNFVAYTRAGQFTESRIGIAVSKKNVRHAIGRNRLKRLARESFRLNTAKLPNLDVVLVFNHTAKHAENSELFHELQQVWESLCA